MILYDNIAVNDMAEYNLLHEILNPSKCVKSEIVIIPQY